MMVLGYCKEVMVTMCLGTTPILTHSLPFSPLTSKNMASKQQTEVIGKENHPTKGERKVKKGKKLPLKRRGGGQQSCARWCSSGLYVGGSTFYVG